MTINRRTNDANTYEHVLHSLRGLHNYTMAMKERDKMKRENMLIVQACRHTVNGVWLELFSANDIRLWLCQDWNQITKKCCQVSFLIAQLDYTAAENLYHNFFWQLFFPWISSLRHIDKFSEISNIPFANAWLLLLLQWHWTSFQCQNPAWKKNKQLFDEANKSARNIFQALKQICKF